MCNFCDNNIYDNKSNYDNWTVVMSEDYAHSWIDIDHIVNFGEFNAKTYSLSFIINYCPFCGRKLEENEDV